MASATASHGPSAPRVSALRRYVPFVIAAVLLTLVFSRIDFAAFFAALSGLNVPVFLGFAVVWQLVLLGADALGNFAAYRLTMPNVRYWDFYLFRGASYIPGMVNHHLGQAYLTYLMARLAGLPVARMAGATLVSYAGWIGCLVGCVAIALPMTELPIGYVPVIVVGGLLYLAVVQLKPAALAKISFLAPLFEAGLRGHAVALVARVPHLLVLVLGTWGAYELFGVKIPMGTALVYLPILLVATTLPITPQGFGTRETVAAVFFAKFAGEGTAAQQLGRVTAATTTWLVAISLVGIVIGVVSARLVQRRLRLVLSELAQPETASAAGAAAVPPEAEPPLAEGPRSI